MRKNSFGHTFVFLATTGIGLASTSQAFAADDDPLESFPLQEHGVLVGAGVAVHTLPLSDTQLRGATTSGFGYVGWLPGALGLARETRMYCSSYHSPEDAQQIADLTAAQRTFPEDANPKNRIKTNPFAIKQKTGWTVGQEASCWWMRWGFFAALPSDFEANVGSGEDDAENRSVRPLVSFGLVLLPLPYVHVLIGPTYSNVALAENAGNTQLWSMFFALGTSIDAVGGVFK